MESPEYLLLLLLYFIEATLPLGIYCIRKKITHVDSET